MNKQEEQINYFIDLIDEVYTAKFKGATMDMVSTGEKLSNINNGVNIELTISWPRSKEFVSMNTATQKQFYNNLYDYVFTKLNIKRYIYKEEKTFEESPDGNIHIHCSILMNIPRVFSSIGLICDIVRMVMSQNKSKLKVNLFNERNLCYALKRYRCPLVCCQIRDLYDFERQEYWINYINKNAPKVA